MLSRFRSTMLHSPAFFSMEYLGWPSSKEGIINDFLLLAQIFSRIPSQLPNPWYKATWIPETSFSRGFAWRSKGWTQLQKRCFYQIHALDPTRYHWPNTDRLKEAALAIFSMAAAVDLGKESYRALLLGKGWPSHRTRGQHPRSPSPVFFLCWMWRMNFQNGPSYVGCCILSTFLHLLKGLKISPHFFRHWNNSGCGPWKKPQPGSKLYWSSRRSMHRS